MKIGVYSHCTIDSIVSGDSLSDDELAPLKIYEVIEEDDNIYLNL